MVVFFIAMIDSAYLYVVVVIESGIDAMMQ